MKYKIEIWIYHVKRETYENNDVKQILKWYKENWKDTYDNLGCTFYLFKNGKHLDFDECDKLGFYD